MEGYIGLEEFNQALDGKEDAIKCYIQLAGIYCEKQTNNIRKNSGVSAKAQASSINQTATTKGHSPA